MFFQEEIQIQRRSTQNENNLKKMVLIGFLKIIGEQNQLSNSFGTALKHNKISKVRSFALNIHISNLNISLHIKTTLNLIQNKNPIRSNKSI